MKTRRTRQSLALAAVAIVAACGGGGGGNGVEEAPGNLPPPPEPLPAVQSGVFKDANVGGLEFASGTETGTTGADGGFTCETGEQVTFSLGSATLGSTDCTTLVTPMSLSASGTLDDTATLNRARFLQMLDVDNDTANGIEISLAVRAAAEDWDPDFATSDLAGELSAIIGEASTADGTAHTLPNASAALEELRATVECAYAGAFAGRMTGDLEGAITVYIGSLGIGGTPFSPTTVGWQAFDAREEFFAGGGGSNSITYSARPGIDHSGVGLAGPISGEFRTPDRITGTWESPAFGHSGSYEVTRMGGDSAAFRFVGEFNSGDAFGSLVLGLDNTEVTGAAFDVVDGTLYDVTGTLNGDVMELTAAGGGDRFEATAAVTRNASGDPRALTGSPSEGGWLFASACRLN